MENTVQQQMGNISLTFVWVSSDRTMFNFANSAKPSMPCHAKWKKFHKQMKKGYNNFALLTKTIPAIGSKSNTSFEILGVYCAFNDKEEMQMVNAQYWDAMEQHSTDWSKLQCTMDVANKMKTWFDENDATQDYSMTTHSILEMLSEGNLKGAKALMKEVV